jgi:hypothetical protein
MSPKNRSTPAEATSAPLAEAEADEQRRAQQARFDALMAATTPEAQEREELCARVWEKFGSRVAVPAEGTGELPPDIPAEPEDEWTQPEIAFAHRGDHRRIRMSREVLWIDPATNEGIRIPKGEVFSVPGQIPTDRAERWAREGKAEFEPVATLLITANRDINIEGMLDNYFGRLIVAGCGFDGQYASSLAGQFTAHSACSHRTAIKVCDGVFAGDPRSLNIQFRPRCSPHEARRGAPGPRKRLVFTRIRDWNPPPGDTVPGSIRIVTEDEAMIQVATRDARFVAKSDVERLSRDVLVALDRAPVGVGPGQYYISRISPEGRLEMVPQPPTQARFS